MTPEQAQKKREWDEGMTNLIDSFPRLWRALYLKCIEEGFTESQAMDLVKTYQMSISGGKP